MTGEQILFAVCEMNALTYKSGCKLRRLKFTNSEALALADYLEQTWWNKTSFEIYQKMKSGSATLYGIPVLIQ